MYKQNLVDKDLNSNEIYSGNNFPFNGSFKHLKFYGHKAYYIEVFPNNKKLLIKGSKWGKIEKKINNAYLNKNLYFHLFIYECKL